MKALSAAAAPDSLLSLPSPQLAPSSGPGRRSRRRALATLAALAGLLHFVFLSAAGGNGGGTPARPGPEPVVVRTLPADPAVAAGTAPMAGRSEPVAVAAAAPVPEARKTPRAPPPAKASARLPEKTVETRPAVTEMAATEPTPPLAADEPNPSHGHPTLAVAETEATDAAVPGMMKVALAESRTLPTFLAAGEAAPPTYRTLLPGPVTLRYELRRGVFRGDGEIRWRPAGRSYALQFEARLAGLTLLSQSSQGELDANGLAPVRFVDQRARKAARAVNFSRDTGTISFSGSTARWPLLAGSQDRLSWMIQLGGIVAANPALAGSGRIAMVLVSSRGEAAVRTARFAGKENAETATGKVAALKFVVDGHSAYDDSFEIWLDPVRGYLPARAVSRSHTGEAEFELLLQRADP